MTRMMYYLRYLWQYYGPAERAVIGLVLAAALAALAYGLSALA